MFYSPAFTFSSIYPLGFCRVPGFALGCCASFKRFWPLALVQQAQAAIVLQALRRLGGAALFRSSCPSPNSGYRFWLLALTFRSNRPACGGRLTSPYKGFPTFASNTSPWVDRTAINPGMVFVNFRSAPSLVHAARRCFLANGADGVTTNGHYAAFWLAANPDERRAPGAPFVSRALGWLP